LLADEVASGNADQLGIEAGAEDSRRRIAAGAGEGAPEICPPPVNAPPASAAEPVRKDRRFINS